MRIAGTRLLVGAAALTVGLCLFVNADEAVAQIAEQTSSRSLEQNLEMQLARNEALRQHIADLERVLKEGVCDNPEAATLLQKGPELKAPPPQ